MAASRGITIKEMVIETRETVRRLDEKLDTVIVEHVKRFGEVEARALAQEAKFDIYIRDRTALISLASSIVASIIILYVATFMPGCTPVPPANVLLSTTVSTVPVMPTSTLTPTWTPTPTAMPDLDTSATATMITPTGSIIEVTPVEGEHPSSRDYWQPLPDGTYYVPTNRLYIRDFSEAVPPIDYLDQPRTGGMIALGDKVLVYTVYVEYASSDKWLCIDPLTKSVDAEMVCPRAVVYSLAGTVFGTLWLP